MSRVFIVMAAASMLPAAAALAYIPASPLPESFNEGPGVHCETQYSLTAQTETRVTINPQYELFYPKSITVKSPHGWFAISEPTIKGDWPRKKASWTLIEKSPQGRLFRVEADDRNAAQFAFLPPQKRQPPLSIEFLAPAGAEDWRKMPPSAEWTDAGITQALATIVFHTKSGKSDGWKWISGGTAADCKSALAR